jgi:amidase
LRAAGVIILGKTNLSEWANMRGNNSISGWSGVGGQTHNPYDLKRTTCGSSSGTGAGVAASFAVIGIGSETDGSIICPSNMNGLVGLKPTVGLVSRTHVIPISATQDTLGAMGRNVIDVAIMTNIMAGTDPLDSATIDADSHKKDYALAINGASLVGKRLGILRDNIGDNPKTNAAFNKTAEKLKSAGAILIEIPTNRLSQVNDGEGVVLIYELKDGMNKYLASTNSKMRTLKDLIAFNNANSDKELQFFGQEDFIKAEATTGLETGEYIHAINRSHDLAGANLNSIFETYKLDALIGPSYGPAWLIDEIYGDQYNGKSMSGMAAVAGFPHLTVPMGQVQGMPIGLSFIGKKWDEMGILSLGYAFENLGKMRKAPKLD